MYCSVYVSIKVSKQTFRDVHVMDTMSLYDKGKNSYDKGKNSLIP